MNKITLKVLKMHGFNPIRDKKTGKLVGISIGLYRNIKLKYISGEAKEYIFSLHPLELSSLEKELL
jgi:hypothetical protein